MVNVIKSSTDTCRIVIADDHAMFRQGLKHTIDGKSGIVIVGEACDGRELLDLMEKMDVDIVIVDISMPGLKGLEAAREIQRNYPDVKVLFLTMHNDMEYLRQAIAVGAEGYVLKEKMDTELFPAIQAIRDGGVYFE